MLRELDIGTPAEWLRRARSNLIRAQQPKPEEVYWEDLCFDAQQAAEKSIKALLVHCGIVFRFVHDIAELLTLLERNGIALPETVRQAASLSDYAVAVRYPGPMEPVTGEECREAVSLAAAVFDWATQLCAAP